MASALLQQQIKAWLFPALMSILAALIWHDVNEVRVDVKALMAQSNIDKTRIDNLERTVYASNPLSEGNREKNSDVHYSFLAVKPDDRIILSARTSFKKK